MALSDYKYTILILVLGFFYMQFFMDHHNNPNQKFQISSDSVTFHANWTKSLDDLCCLSKVHNALQLQNIKNLDISFSMSSFNDSEVMKILNVRQFKNYESIKLELSGLKLTNEGVLNILKLLPTSVKNLQLHLNGLKFTSGFGLDLATQLNTITNLQQLKVSLIMSINENQVDSFIQNHKPTEKLQTLHLILIGNQITKKGISHTKEYFSRLNVNDFAFNLYANKIESDGAELLSEALKELTNLNKLNIDLYFNNVTELGTENISSAIQTMTNLTALTLNLDFNYIKNEGAKALGKSLQTLTQLQHLYLGVASKNFGYLGFKSLINSLEKLTQLKSLSLRCGVNRVGYNGAQITKEMLSKMTQLEYLEIGFLQNYVGDDGISLLAEHISQMKTLKSVFLNFNFNDAKSFGLIRVIKSFLNSNYETLHLSLSSNQFRDSEVKLIQSHLTTLIKNNDRFLFDFTETAISKKQMTRLEKIFAEANVKFNKNAKLNVNSIIPEEQAKPAAQTQNKSQVKPQVEPKIENNSSSVQL